MHLSTELEPFRRSEDLNRQRCSIRANLLLAVDGEPGQSGELGEPAEPGQSGEPAEPGGSLCVGGRCVS